MADELLIKDLRAQIERGQVIAIVGAGISMGATNGNPLATWTGLLEDGVARCWEIAQPLPDDWRERVLAEIRSRDLDDLLAAAEKVSSKLDAPNGGEYRRWLRETVGSLKTQHRGVIEALHALGIKLATTNYDGLIEEVTGLPPVTWAEGAKVERVIRGDDQGVLHLHGYWAQPESVILGIRSYAKVMGDAHAQNVLHALQTMKTLLFVGCGAGLKDPNFGGLLRWSGTVFAQSEYRRFRLAKSSEVNTLQAEHPKEQRLFVLPFGNDHADLEPFLRTLRTQISEPRPPIVQESKSAALPPAQRCFGREHEVEALVAALLIENPQPVPILGPPGIGKTTISLAALHDPRVVKRYGAKRYFIRCDGIRTREALAAQIGLAIGLSSDPEIESAMIESAMLAALRASPTALVIDNAETPWEADTLRVEELFGQVAGIPTLALVTSVRGLQRPFGVAWRESIQPSSLSREAARDTFLSIGGQKFENDPHLDALLTALDYVPLAVTLMAYAAEGEPDLASVWKRWQRERTRMLQRAHGNERLTNIEVSYETSISSNRMTENARRLLKLFAYLPNGVTPEELERIFPIDCYEAPGVLRKAGLAFDEPGRCRVLAPLREYVREKHPPDPDDLKRLINFYLERSIAEGSKVGFSGGSDAILRIAPQLANLEGAILQGLQSDHSEKAIKAALALAMFARLTGLGSSQALEKAASKAQTLGEWQTAADCIQSLGGIALARSQHEAARTRFEEALLLYRQVGDVLGEANCILSLGVIALRRSQHEAARARFEEALPLFRQVGSVLGEANCIRSLGNIALRRSQQEAARARFEEALPLFRQVGFVLGEANCIHKLGDIALQRSQHDAARARFEHALPLFREVGSVLGEANCILSLGGIALRRSQHDAARARFEQALPLYRQVGAVLGEANCIHSLGDIALRRSQHDDARTRFEEALQLFMLISEPYSIGTTHHRLARLASDTDERKSHVIAAIAAWEQI